MPADKRARLKEWLASGEAKLHPLSFPQRELWEASPVPVADPSNHICCIIEIRGLITERDCRTAIQRVVDRQEALRISFLPGKEQPLQMIRRTSEFDLTVREISESDGRPEHIEELAAEIFSTPFDLVAGPLFRVVMLRRAANDHVLVFAIHHAIADGWTLGVFVQDLFAAYLQIVMGADAPLPPVPQTCVVWGAAERAWWQPALLEERASFWKGNLAGTKRQWTAPIPPGPPRRRVSHIPAALATEARELARRTGATLYSTLLAAFQIAHAEWTGAADLVVGTPVANRAKPSVRETMGYCAGIVPVRGQVDRTRTAADHLRATHEAGVDAFATAMPFAELTRALGESPAASGINPIFEVRFALQNHPIPEVSFPTLGAKLGMRSTGTPRFQLACEITEEREGLEVVWLSRETLFSLHDIEDLNRIFQRVLAGICTSSDSQISKLI